MVALPMSTMGSESAPPLTSLSRCPVLLRLGIFYRAISVPSTQKYVSRGWEAVRHV